MIVAKDNKIEGVVIVGIQIQMMDMVRSVRMRAKGTTETVKY